VHVARSELVLRRPAGTAQPLEGAPDRLLVRALDRELGAEAPPDRVEHDLGVRPHGAPRGHDAGEAAEILPVRADLPTVGEAARIAMPEDAGQVLVGVDDVPLGKGEIAVRLTARVTPILHQRRAGHGAGLARGRAAHLDPGDRRGQDHDEGGERAGDALRPATHLSDARPRPAPSGGPEGS